MLLWTSLLESQILLNDKQRRTKTQRTSSHSESPPRATAHTFHSVPFRAVPFHSLPPFASLLHSLHNAEQRIFELQGDIYLRPKPYHFHPSLGHEQPFNGRNNVFPTKSSISDPQHHKPSSSPSSSSFYRDLSTISVRHVNDVAKISSPKQCPKLHGLHFHQAHFITIDYQTKLVSIFFETAHRSRVQMKRPVKRPPRGHLRPNQVCEKSSTPRYFKTAAKKLRPFIPKT